MHEFSTASPPSSVLTGLHDPQGRVPLGLLGVPTSTLAGTWGTRKRVTRQVKPALAALRDKNLCI